ncbi:hypothetical protein VTL71DRAFT_13155 [Oculimacula yallundae]|uniref:Uncharacterized protein n=1 Tax=Oculimacula yallundae TaxID=86028 RepID=A0ABR4CQ13_9HELO
MRYLCTWMIVVDSPFIDPGVDKYFSQDLHSRILKFFYRLSNQPLTLLVSPRILPPLNDRGLWLIHDLIFLFNLKYNTD